MLVIGFIIAERMRGFVGERRCAHHGGDGYELAPGTCPTACTYDRNLWYVGAPRLAA